MRARILIVEDDDASRDLLTRLLQVSGYRADAAPDAAGAMEILRANPPDLILMDVRLPDEDGCQLTRRLKQDHSTRSIPVIALTAHAMIGDRERCLEAGIDEYETKPIDFPILMQKIGKLLLTSAVH
jgi:CheY-like chemotaxis protein